MPRQRTFRARAGRIGPRWWPSALLLLAGAGCGGRPEAPAIVPDSAKAREVLGRAMAAWVAGRPAGMLDATAPRVQVVDSFRKPGQKLEGFEVLSETTSPRARTFSLRLRLTGPDDAPVVRFLVVGIDPVLVFRQEDYDMLAHFEHKMDPEPRPGGEAPPLPGGTSP